MGRGKPSRCDSEPSAGTECRVESLVSVDDRGQMVLPKEVRDAAGIQGGDKLALVGWRRDGRLCCLALMKVEALGGMVQEILAPILGGDAGSGDGSGGA